MSTKKCFKCHRIKDIKQFYRHNQMADGHLNKCKSCTKLDVHKRYNNPKSKTRITEYERKRFKDPNRKRLIKIYQQVRRSKRPGKYKAYSKVRTAVRNGQLKKQPCKICGNPKSQAHHDDYREYLKVTWLCFKHHREKHNQLVNS